MTSATNTDTMATIATGAHTAVGSHAELITFQLLIQLIVILAVTRAVVWFSRRVLGQTDVAGEILAGLVLGPSVLGLFFPGAIEAIFVPGTATIFVGMAQIGLILLMFQIGMEFNFKDTLSGGRHATIVVSLVGIVVPFMAGFLTAPWFWDRMPDPRPDAFAFQLFFATAMSITAIPILGRIFMELGLSHTRTAALTIGAAAIDDLCGWLILGVVSAIITASFHPGAFGVRLALVLAYIAFVMIVVRPLTLRFLRRQLAAKGHLSPTTASVVLLLLIGSAAITSTLGIFAIIGGFLIGVALHDDRVFVEEWRHRFGGLVQSLFLPIFFTYTGLRTNIGSLGDADAWMQCALVVAVAFAGKFCGVYIAARLIGETRRNAMTIGVCMNTRALMELVVLNIGYDLGVLPRPMFTMLVIMAIVSTFVATPLIRWLMVDQRRHADTGTNRQPALSLAASPSSEA